MTRRENSSARCLLVCAGAALLLITGPAQAQLISAGAGPAFPNGDFSTQLDPGSGLFLSGRVNLSLLFLQVQFELARASWSYGAGNEATDLRILQPAVNLQVHFIRVATVRPYALAGVVGSNQTVSTSSSDDTTFRIGYQAGLGVDFKFGWFKPFVEARLVSLDGPGELRYTYTPVLVGVNLF